LEEKLDMELEGLENRMEEMKYEMIKFQDIDKAKADAAEKTILLQKEKMLWEEKLKYMEDELSVVQHDYDRIQVSITHSD